MELATLRTLYFANLYRERARNRQIAEVARELPARDPGFSRTDEDSRH